MTSDPNARPTLEVYEGRQLILTPVQHDDGTWACEYIIIELGPNPASTRGVAGGTFGALSSARVAALLEAEKIINARVAISAGEAP